jgi:hypothetical protein
MAGKYAAWDPPLSYSSVMLLSTDLGVYKARERACLRDAQIVSAVSCPAGFYKRPLEEIAGRCGALGLSCPAGYTCLCSPCRRADEVEVFAIR